MSGFWIKVETTTPDKPEIFQIAEALAIDPDAVFGKLMRVWIWADQHTIDGTAKITFSLIDRVTGFAGFGVAMMDAGWIESTADGLTFTNFSRHNGNTAKTRASAASRQRKTRNDSPPMLAAETDDQADEHATESPAGKPDQAVSKRSGNYLDALLAAPERYRSVEFVEAIKDWNETRSVNGVREPLTATALKNQLYNLSSWELTTSDSLACIRQAASAGWKSLRRVDSPAATKERAGPVTFAQQSSRNTIAALSIELPELPKKVKTNGSRNLPQRDGQDRRVSRIGTG